MQPSVPETHSISRLEHRLKSEPFLDPHECIRVGGRIQQIGEKTQLSSCGTVLEFSWPQVLPLNSLAWIEFEIHSLGGIEGQFQVSAVKELKVIQSVVQATPLQKKMAYSYETAISWSRFLKAIRGYFTSQGLLEVTTPTLVQNPGMEPELEPFATQLKIGKEHHSLFLATSPELHLKQLLAQGITDLFEIKTVFRNEENTEIHEPEFQMLEWYRGFADLEKIIADLKGLLFELKKAGFPGLNQDLKIQEIRIPDLFRDILNLELTPQTTREDLLRELKKNNETPDPAATWNDLYHHLWVAKIEPQFPKGLVFLRDFPASQAALAQINDRGFADRFEMVWDGVEIANAFHELTDPIEQRQRFERDQKIRIQYGRTPLKIDENFMSVLEWGLPPSAGIAVGMDRLFMKCAQLDSIKAGRAFGVRHQLPQGL